MNSVIHDASPPGPAMKPSRDMVAEYITLAIKILRNDAGSGWPVETADRGEIHRSLGGSVAGRANAGNRPGSWKAVISAMRPRSWG
jgi:hypothetical protein